MTPATGEMTSATGKVIAAHAREVTSVQARHVASAEAADVASAEATHVTTAEATHVTSAEAADVTSATAHVASATAAPVSAAAAAAACLRIRRKQSPGKRGRCQDHHHSSSHDILLRNGRNFPPQVRVRRWRARGRQMPTSRWTGDGKANLLPQLNSRS
jgi:hypothetical protein